MKNKITSAAQGGAYHIEHTNKSAINNNVCEDSTLMNDIFEKFTDLEVVFMLNHFNKEKIFENHLTKRDLRELPVLFVLKFLTTIKVAEFGKAVLQIIQIKLINQI
jgi:hypothetical protein